MKYLPFYECLIPTFNKSAFPSVNLSILKIDAYHQQKSDCKTGNIHKIQVCFIWQKPTAFALETPLLPPQKMQWIFICFILHLKLLMFAYFSVCSQFSFHHLFHCSCRFIDALNLGFIFCLFFETMGFFYTYYVGNEGMISLFFSFTLLDIIWFRDNLQLNLILYKFLVGFNFNLLNFNPLLFFLV